MTTLQVSNIAPVSGNVITVLPNNILNAPGSVLQVVQTVYSSSYSTAIGNGWVTIPYFSALITPTYRTSKVMVNLSMCYGIYSYQLKVRLIRNGIIATGALGNLVSSQPQSWLTAIWYDQTANTNAYYMDTLNGQYLDSPNSTTPLTYEIQIGGYTASNLVYVNRNYTYSNTTDYDATPISTLTLMEIAQ